LDGQTGELFERRLTRDHTEIISWMRSLPGPAAASSGLVMRTTASRRSSGIGPSAANSWLPEALLAVRRSVAGSDWRLSQAAGTRRNASANAAAPSSSALTYPTKPDQPAPS
jgi:hypothetical protein